MVGGLKGFESQLVNFLSRIRMEGKGVALVRSLFEETRRRSRRKLICLLKGGPLEIDYLGR